MTTKLQNPSNSNHTNHYYPEELLDDSRGLDLKDFLNVVSRYKNLILITALITMLAALAATLMMKPVYRAYASIKVERHVANPNVQILNAETSRSDRDFFETQIQLLQTKSLASKVIEELDLKSKDQATSLLHKLKTLFKVDTGGATTKNLSNEEELFLENLLVKPIPNSQLLSISYDSTSPDLAAKIANTVATTFVTQNLDRRFESASAYKQYITENIEVTKKSLADAERRLNEYAKNNNIVKDAEGKSADSYTLKKQAEELVSAERERIEAEAAYASYLKNPNDTPTFINEDPYILSLKKAAARLETQYQTYSNRTTRTPRRLRKQIDELRLQIEAETQALKESLKNNLEEAQQKENVLREQLNKLRKGALNTQSKNTTYTRLLREVEVNQLAYNQQLEQLMAVNVASNVSTNNISIIDRATPPTKKYKPSLKTNLLFGLLLGSLLGLGIAFLREFIDDSIKTSKLLEQSTGLPVLAQLPNVKRTKAQELALKTAQQPHSPLAESVRSLRTSLRFATPEGAPKTTFITSAIPGEGKSTLALNLATAYAQAGTKVLLIDADLRNPSINHLLSVIDKDIEIGLSGYLSNANYDLEQIINKCRVEGLHVITAGAVPADPVELLSSKRMQSLIAATSGHYDHIIIDGAPVLGLADSLVLGNMAEGTLLAVEAGKTKKAALTDSLKRLERANANIIGTVLTRVGPQNNPDYNVDYYSYSNRKNT